MRLYEIKWDSLYKHLASDESRKNIYSQGKKFGWGRVLGLVQIDQTQWDNLYSKVLAPSAKTPEEQQALNSLKIYIGNILAGKYPAKELERYSNTDDFWKKYGVGPGPEVKQL